MQTVQTAFHAPEGIPPKMVTDYVARWLVAVPVAAAALDQCEYGQLRVFGHRLKGSGGGYGIPPLTDMGSAIELAAGRRDITELRSQIVALEDYLKRIEILS